MTRALPLSWLVVDTLAQALRVVRVADGYYTDFGASVRADRYSPNEDEGAHCVVIATDIPLGEVGNTARKGSIELVIECRVPADADDAEKTAHLALADVLEVLSPRQRGAISWPDGCGGVTPTGRRILERPQDMPFVVAQVTARAGLVERPAARE